MGQNIYKGISFPFRFNAQGRVEKSKLTPTDFTRIQESIRQIIFTYQLERIMTTGFGMTRDYMFSPLEDVTDQGIFKHNILEAIQNEEPRVIVNECTLYPDPMKDATLIVELDLHIIKFVKDVNLKIAVETNGGMGEMEDE